MRTRDKVKQKLRPEKQRKNGKRFIEVDWARVDKLLEAGCNGREIAGNLGIHSDTLYAACEREKGMIWSSYAAHIRASGDSLLRAAQFKKAMAGDGNMLKWLGINRLAQSDKVNHEISGNITVVVRGAVGHTEEQKATEGD